jgi:hypothetical protein
VDQRREPPARVVADQLAVPTPRDELVWELRLEPEVVEHDGDDPRDALVEGARQPRRPPALRRAGDDEAPEAAVDRLERVHRAHRGLRHGEEAHRND